MTKAEKEVVQIYKKMLLSLLTQFEGDDPEMAIALEEIASEIRYRNAVARIAAEKQ